MYKDETLLNHIVVELFNEILKTEEHTISNSEFDNISLKEIHVIEAVCVCEEQNLDNSATSIATTLKITPGSLTTSVSLLEKKGYLKRKKDDKDKRIVRIYSTKNGREAHKIHMDFHHEMVEETLKNLTSEEIEVLIKSIESIEAFFKKKIEG